MPYFIDRSKLIEAIDLIIEVVEGKEMTDDFRSVVNDAELPPIPPEDFRGVWLAAGLQHLLTAAIAQPETFVSFRADEPTKLRAL